MNKKNFYSLIIIIFLYSVFNLCRATEIINVNQSAFKINTIPASKEDVGYKILKDNQSNYYILGKAAGDIILIKYSSIGTSIWTKYFYGFENGEDIPKSMVMDCQGNICIFGVSYTNPVNTDFILLKCNNDGEQIWLRKIYNPYPSQSEAGNITLDNFGNIYICGATANSAGDYDYITFKYDNNGTQLWSAVYDGGFGNDKTFDIVVDNSQNVYVTGCSLGNGTMFDIATVKYANSETEKWVRRYNCSLNKSDCGRFITLNSNFDNSAYPIIIGESDSLFNGVQKRNIIAFEYDQNGNIQWFFRHQKYGTTSVDSGYYCNSFTKDSLQNIYIGCSADWTMPHITFYKTVKINNSGIQQWYRDEAFMTGKVFSTDINNNYLITSASYYLNSNWSPFFYRYSLDGQLFSSHAYNGNYGNIYTGYSTVLDSTNKIIMTGIQKSNSDNNIFTIKWDTSGITNWTLSYDNNIQPYDIPFSLILDNVGNVYMAGVCYASSVGSDVVIYKYTPNLTQIWQTTYKGIGFNHNQPVIVKLDSSQNIFVGTSIKDSSGYYKFLLLKYVSNSLSWSKELVFTGYNNAELKFLEINNGNVYISGNITNQSLIVDIITLKLNLNGDTIWSKLANGTGILNSKVKAMKLDDSANIYLTGKVYLTESNNNSDFITIKYSSNGMTRWNKIYNSSFNQQDEPNSIAIDSFKNVYVTGISQSTNSGIDFLTLKYDADGSLLWNSRYNNSDVNGNDTAKVVIPGDSNSVYVGGNIQVNANSGSDIYLIKYNQFGDTIWTKRYNRSGNYDDLLKTMIKGHRGDIFIAGKSFSSNNVFDGIYLRYDKSGKQKWTFSYNTGISGTKDPIAIVEKDSIKLYTSLANYTSSTSAENHIVNLSQSYYITGIRTLNNEIPQKYRLMQNYPNPFNPVTKIKFDLRAGVRSQSAKAEEVKLAIYDILGRAIQTLVNEKLNPGTYEVTFDGSNYASGIYFYQLRVVDPTRRTGEYIETKKLVLLK
jgi:hypothetical protein